MKKQSEKNMQNPNEEVQNKVGFEEESNIEQILKKYKNQVIIGVVAVVVIVLLSVFLFNSNTKKSEEASLLLSRILPYYEQGAYDVSLNGDKKIDVRGQSLKGLIYIVNEYKSTEAGKLAALYTGSALVNLHKYQEATEYFDIAMDNASKVVKQGASAGMGQIKEYEKNYKEASDYYLKASDFAIDNEIKAQYTLYSAICLEKAQDKNNAEKQYKIVLNLAPNSEYSEFAKEGLTRLGIVID